MQNSDQKERIIYLKKEKTALVVPEKQDVFLWYKGMNDIEINKFLGNASAGLYFFESEERYYENITKDKNLFYFGIYSLEQKKVIGNVSLDCNFVQGFSTLGIVIFDKKFHGKGHGKEAMEMMLEFGFNFKNLRKIELTVFSNNPKAISLYEKLGFKKVGIRKQKYFVLGEYIDEILMEIFRDEYLK